MRDDTVPENVGALLDRHIYSIRQLELLLLLYRTRQAWTVASVSRELRTETDATLFMLSTLANDGLIVRTEANQMPAFKYQCSPLEQDIEDLAKVFEGKKMRVIQRIYQNSPAELAASRIIVSVPGDNNCDTCH